jgi:multimeric flavodoxin WrbA
MCQMSGQAKIFMDRFFPVVDANFATRLTRHPALAVAVTQGQTDVDTYRQYFEGTAQVFAFLGFRPAGMVIGAGTHGKNDVDQRTDLLEQARAVGRELVRVAAALPGDA